MAQSGDTHAGAKKANSAFVLLSPVNAKSNTKWQTDQVKALIDYVIAHHNISSKRISISGHSAGSKGTWAMIEAYPDFFTSAVPISDGPTDFSGLSKVAKLPIRCAASVDGD